MERQRENISETRVWIGKALRDTILIRPFVSDIAEARYENYRDAYSRARIGHVLPQNMVARALYAKEPRKNGQLPDFFEGSSYTIVSKRFADVLRGFDLGDCKLYDVDVFEHDRKTRCAGEYELLYIDGTNGAFLPEHSRDLRKAYRVERDIWHLIKIEDGSMAVTGAAARMAPTSGPKANAFPFISSSRTG